MKLKNKKTGEIKNAVDIDMYTDSVYLKVSDSEFDNETIEYHSLAELNEEWEDYEESKEYWFIDTGSIPMVKKSNNPILPTGEDIDKQIGNYFETKEETERAVEKLKAWKRLKDKGFRFTGITPNRRYIKYNYGEILSKHGICYDKAIQFENDLDLLFGGEDE